MTNLKKIITDFPNQLKVGFEIAKDIRVSSFRNVIFCGMGGSIMPAEILFTLFPELPNNFHIHRDFDLPAWATKDDLTVCISWSGNTAETISSYEKAKKWGVRTLIITKGGKIAELAKNNNDLIITLPQKAIPPRSGIGYMFTVLLTVLINSGMIDFNLEELANLGKELKPERLEKRGKELVEKIGNQTPLIYSSFQNRFLASFWKVKFNESSKIHAFWNHFPNLSHNEIAGFTASTDTAIGSFVILLSDSEDDNRQQKKTSVTAKILEENGIPYQLIKLEGKTRLEKIFNDYILSDWVSFYLAKNRGVEPTETEMIEKFKKLEK